MGCGMSKPHPMDNAFGKRTAATATANPKLLIKDTPQSSPSSSSPQLQKINTNGGGRNSNVDSSSWFGSPSFREYIKPSPRSTTGNEQGEKEKEKENVVGKQGGQKVVCNGEVCELRPSGEDVEHADKKETRIGRFRKVFHVQKSTFSWHGRPWHIGHPKATKKTA